MSCLKENSRIFDSPFLLSARFVNPRTFQIFSPNFNATLEVQTYGDIRNFNLLRNGAHNMLRSNLSLTLRLLRELGLKNHVKNEL